MDNRPENDLRDHIKRVFDDFEAPNGAADAGWKALREQYPVRKRRPAAIWWSAAAAVLLFIGLGLWLMYQPQIPAKQSIVRRKAVTEKILKTGTAVPSASKRENNPVSALTVASRRETPVYNQIAATYHTEPLFTTPSDTSQPNLVKTNVLALKQPGNAAQDSNIVLNNQDINATTAKVQDVQPEPTPAENGMDAVFAREKALAKQNTTNRQETTARDKRLVLSVYAGTYLNYAKGSSNQINAGAGFNSDIRLLKKVKLVTGLAIAQNRLRYDSEPTQSNVYAAAMAAAGNQPELTDLRVNAFFAGISQTSTPVTQLKGYNASFTGLDIPVNIKYEFNPGKSDSYILAGVSSGTFINETYRYNYSSGLLPSVNQTAETQARFSTFDFARTLNVAIGIGAPVGKGNSLIVEPFLKYPLSGLGSQQIRFGASGVNLKFRFSSRR